MRCLACGAEMHLMHVVQDDTVAVRGFERHTHICSACGEVEPRLVFTRPVEPSHTKPVALFSSTAENARAAARAFFRHAFAKLYDARDKVKQLVVRYGKASRFKEPQSVLIAPHAFAASISSEKNTDLDECEALLRRAGEIVRDPTPFSQPAIKKSETTSEVSAESTSSAQAEGTPLASRIVVQIHHDPRKAKYVAKDTKSGLSILRHQDSQRLRAMCNRMGWDVVDGAEVQLQRD